MLVSLIPLLKTLFFHKVFILTILFVLTINLTKISDIHFVSDFFNEQGFILDWNKFMTQFSLNNNDFFKWRQLVHAIPKRWKNIVKHSSDIPISTIPLK